MPLSYRLHAELAAEHNGGERWGYRRKIGCGSISAVVRTEDLQKRPRAGTTIPGADAAPTNGDGQKKESASQQSQPAAEALPIQSVDQPSADPSPERDYVPFADAAEEEPQNKEWEKLPKQDASAQSLLSDSPLPPDLDWIDASLVTDYAMMGHGRAADPETAQVHPYHFTTSMAQLARDGGANFVLGAKVTAINHSKTSGVGSVEYEDRSTGGERVMDGVTDVVVTAGPWTGKLLPKTKVEGLRAHSVVYAADVSPYAVFTDIQLPGDYVPDHRREKGQKRKHKGRVDPEIYARPFGEVYACGMSFLPPLRIHHMTKGLTNCVMSKASPTPASRSPRRPTRSRPTRRSATTSRPTSPPCPRGWRRRRSGPSRRATCRGTCGSARSAARSSAGRRCRACGSRRATRAGGSRTGRPRGA